MITRFFAVLVVVCSTLAAGETGKIVVSGPSQFDPFKKQVEKITNGGFSAQLALTGLRDFGQPMQIVLIDETADLAKETPSWISGYALGNRGIVVLFPKRVRSYPDRNLRHLVQHEVTHVFVARAARGRYVPRWFNEGIATVAAREWGLEDRARVAMTIIGKRPRNVTVLDRWFRGDTTQVTRAYALSSAFVRFLLKRHGELTPARILDGIADGQKFDEAFFDATGQTLRAAERAFFKEEALWNAWLPFFTSSGGLWMVITVLALVAIKRRRDRSRLMHETWDEEEMGLAGDDDMIH